MVLRRIRAPRIDFSGLRRELDLPTAFPEAADREAEAAAKERHDDREDRTDLEFVTIDPPTSKDLDQALLLQRQGSGYRVYYAIADVAAFTVTAPAIEAETWRRGQTVYLPDGKVPLHPPVLSEGAASLLPDQDRPAVLWTIDVDGTGVTVGADVRRATVRSRAKLNYAQVQRDVDAGTPHPSVQLLPELGRLLTQRGLDRGAVNLPMPEQEIEPDGDGWKLVIRGPVPVEEFNAQISLLTGMAAAQIMLKGGIGLLRTMPPPEQDAVRKLRLAARALGLPWPDGAGPGAVIAALDPMDPKAAAFIDQAAEMMRGAGYTPFDGAAPEQPLHGAVAAPYAHVTAPLRRLADRYVTEVCLALHTGAEVPAWARDALPRLPEVMSRTDRVANAAERGAVDLVEAVLLQHRVGEEFDAAVLDVDRHRADIALDEPPVRARCEGREEGGDLPLGERIRVRLTEADPTRRKVLFHTVRLDA
ncbi:RNB domain-containing ribonuclease [Dactylosporangium aurantiacum]|uniref:RNB domain-containing ribonuclease n=1 Tax=Dactylosporangium aurantiacum TaxID=35754 RepID=A0A9Q9ML08_9ACTN|nr:RNB domain-containing ribonuclease [Dactylosporangium aurantiacum]MDG6102368.1 RNB domain-containing ribonuclease [Dactylosporangium aurantiacum]UWZ53337.1 RNB domain-containing ribonuclease [Dactylosporangium aurantiacum]